MKCGKHARRSLSLLAKMMVFVIVLSLVVPVVPAYAGENDVMAYGYGIDGKYEGKWTTGNLGKTYSEGEWVAFQTEISNINWSTGPNGLKRVGVEFDFYDNGGRFYDLIRNISIGEQLLDDDHGFPMQNGEPFPINTDKTEATVNAAQRDPNVGGDFIFSEFEGVYANMNPADWETFYRSQVNRDINGNTGTATDQTRIFYLERDQILETLGYDPEAATDTFPNTVVVYFQLHLSRTWLWNNQADFNGKLTLAHAYTNEPAAKWGGYVYDSDFLTDNGEVYVMPGSYIYPGSSGHSFAYVMSNNGGMAGQKTIPIPDVAETTGKISGIKFEDMNGNGSYDPDVDKPLQGWQIYLRTDLYEIMDLEFPATTDENGYFEFKNIPYNLVWELSEVVQQGYIQTYPNSSKPEPSGTYKDNPDPENDWWKVKWDVSNDPTYSGDSRGAWGWSIKLEPKTHITQENADFGNMKADPRVEIKKEGDLLSKVGDKVEYTFTVTNIGNVELDLVSIVDDKLGTLDEYGKVGMLEDKLPVGATQSFKYEYEFKTGDADPFINTVTANYKYGDIPAIDAEGKVPQDSHETQLFQPGITISKTVDKELAKVGDKVKYTITVTNTSSKDSPNLEGKVTDALLGLDESISLAPEAFVEYVIERVITADDPDPLVNTASVKVSPAGFPNVLEKSSKATINLFQPQISIEKTGDEISKAGDTINYVIKVKNTSSSDSPILEGKVEDSFLGLSESISIAPGETKTFYASHLVTTEDTDPVVNTAKVTVSPAGYTDVIESESSWSTDLVHPSIEIDKTVAPTSVTAGDTVTYTIKITNTGDVKLENIVVTDDIHQSLLPSFASSLAAGASDTKSFTYTTTENDPAVLTDTATVHANPAGLPNDITDSDSAELSIAPKKNEETVWGFDEGYAIEFKTLGFKNWGWTNGKYTVTEGSEYDMVLYAGKYEYAGDVYVKFLSDKVEVTYEAASGVTLDDLHLYIGKTELPKVRGKMVNNPGQFPYSASVDGETYTFSIGYSDLGVKLGDQVYVAAHGVAIMP